MNARSQAAVPPAQTPRGPVGAPRDRDRSGVPLLVVAELALAGVTFAAVLGLARLFVDGSFLLPVLTVGATAHLLAGWCRRRPLRPGTTALVAVGGLAAVVSWLLLPATTAYGLPTTATLGTMGDQLSSALSTFREVVAPAPVEPGFVLASAIGVWIIAFVADTAAFRAGATVEAAIPGATLFVFAAALGAPRQRELTTALFLAGVLGYWLAQRARANAASPTWLSHDARAGSRSLLRTGGALAVAVVIASLAIGPALPGATEEAVIPWRAGDRGDGSLRVTISPLVDIRSRIVDQAQAVVFTVASDERSYWRLTSLETFDGRIWSSARSYEDASGELPPGARLEPVASRTSTQEFEVGALSSIWLPAAYRPIGIDGTSASFDDDSGSLIVSDDIETTQPGQRYTIRSVIPELTDEALAGVEAEAPAEIVEGYTALPDDFSGAVRAEALEITGSAPTPYAKALALQDHFRDGSFTYDLDVDRGHGGDDLERFLFGTKTGYCEQFAGAYAAMARAAGLPARVAVGFTPGEQGPDGRLVVRGANGHAWPEVYLEGYGWVPFEPTPGRGIPGATEYTGVPEQQAAVTDPSSATTLPAPAPAPVDPAAGATDALPDLGSEEVLPGVDATPAPSPWPRRLLVAALLVVGLPALWVGLVAAAGWLSRRRRRAAATTPEERVALAWVEAREALTAAGATARRSETPSEVAAGASEVPGVEPERLALLAELATTAAYAPGGTDDDDAVTAEAAAASLVRGTRATWGRRQRVRAAFDPRPHLPRRAARRRVGAADLGSEVPGLTSA